MIKKFLIKILFRLLDPEVRVGEINEKRVTEWLAQQYQDVGFHEYFRKRDLTILKTMGSGVDQESYQLMMGKRLEVIALLHKVEIAYNKKQEGLKQKVEKANNKKVKK